MKDLLLGIDIGTSACKLAVFDLDGNVLAQSTKEYETFYPHEGFAQQNPDDWWGAVCDASRELFCHGGICADRVASIGIDGQSWSAIPITKAGKVLYDTPIWFDTRASQICEKLKQEIGEEAIFNLCGNPLKPSYTLPKILWFKENMPEVYENADYFLQSNSFLAYRLTNQFTQDVSQGYGLQCYDMKKRMFDKTMCDKMGVSINKLPQLFESHEVIGTVTQKAALKTLLTEGTPVVAGGLDAACGALGVGVIHAGETQEQGGQAGGMSICMENYHADKQLILGNHVVPGKWLLQGGTVGGGGVIRWFEKEFCEPERILALQNNTSSFYEMDKKAAKIPAGADGVVFLPYMAGERSPIWDEQAKGVYYGLNFSKTRAHMLRASLEGVAFSLLHNLDVAQMAGVSAKELRAMGGAANSKLWMQIKADITGKKILVPSSDTATTLGAAILAGVGVNAYKSFEEAVHRTVKIKHEYIPDTKKWEVYQKNYKMYLELYKHLKPLMKDEN